MTQHTAVVGATWGDEGKGKTVDELAEDHDIVVRLQGGKNAGHTVWPTSEEKFILHGISVGVLKGKISVQGPGVKVDLLDGPAEIKDLQNRGIEITPDNLKISDKAHVVMPYHSILDIAEDLRYRVGTTGSGMGPVHADEAARRGIQTISLLHPDDAIEKFKRFKDLMDHLLKFYVTSDVEEELHSKLQKKNLDDYLKSDLTLNQERVIGDIYENSEFLAPFIINTEYFLHEADKNGLRILLEMAQATLIGKTTGTYGFNTPSEPSALGIHTGLGYMLDDIKIIGIIKAINSRVGNGPFVAEIGGAKSEKYCAKGRLHDIEYELSTNNVPFEYQDGKISYDHNHSNIMNLIDSKDPFLQGVGIRLLAEEYGATTQRPRRMGWQDLFATKYSAMVNQFDEIRVIKLDVLSGLKELLLCTGYSYLGEQLEQYSTDANILYNCKPVLEGMPGWQEDISKTRRLPDEAVNYLMKIQKFLDVPITYVSIGKERDHIIEFNGGK